MKNRLISGILFIVLGVLIAIGPITFIPVCGVHALGNSEDVCKTSDTKMNDTKTDVTKDDGDKSSMEMSSNMVMTCHWTARAELGIGFVIAILGVLLIVLQSAQIRIGIHISLTLNGILALLIPNTLIGVCKHPHSQCHSLTLPALTILSIVVILAAIINVIYLYKSQIKGKAIA